MNKSKSKKVKKKKKKLCKDWGELHCAIAFSNMQLHRIPILWLHVPTHVYWVGRSAQNYPTNIIGSFGL